MCQENEYLNLQQQSKSNWTSINKSQHQKINDLNYLYIFIKGTEGAGFKTSPAGTT